MSPRPILILSAGRAGSHLLRSFFQPPEAVLDVREFLNPSAVAHGPQGFWSTKNPEWGRRLAAESSSDPKSRYAIARDYVASLIAEASEKAVLADLKYHHIGPLDALWRMPDEPPPIVKAFLEADAAVLHLVRTNPLAQLCSLKLGLKTGVWYRPAGEAEQANPKIALHHRDLLDSLRRIEFRKAAAEFWLSWHRRKLTVTYEELLDGDRLAPRIRKDIGALVGPDIDLSSRAGSQKIAPPLAELIANIDEVRAALRDTAFAWCLDSDTAPANDSTAFEDLRVATATSEGSTPAVVWPVPRAAASRSAGPVLFCRELPLRLGGTVDLPALAMRFRKAGMRPILVLPGGGSGPISAPDTPVLQCPLWPALVAGQVGARDMDYADLLAAIGFTDETAVRAMAAAWRSLVEALRPVAIVAEHAPALVACLGRGGVPIVHVGNALTTPPIMATGFPRLHGQRRPLPPVSRMLAATRAAVAGRSAGASRGTGSAGEFAALFRAQGRVVIDFPEMDPYRSLRAEELAVPTAACGPLPAPSAERRLLVFLPPTVMHRDRLLDAVAAATVSAETVAPPETTADLHASLAPASHVLCLAGSSVSVAALAGARPQLIVPNGSATGSETVLIERLQVGQRIDPSIASARLAEQIRGFVASPLFLEKAATLADQIRLRRMPDGGEIALETVTRLITQTAPAAA